MGRATVTTRGPRSDHRRGLHPVRLLVAVALLVTSAREVTADVLPEPDKLVKSSVLVEGAIDPGRALVVAGPRQEGSPLALGQPHTLRSIGASETLKIVMVDAPGGAPESGVPCSPPFRPTTSLRAGADADEVRYVYRVSTTSSSCTADFVRTEYLTASGSLVARDEGEKRKAAPLPAASAAPAASTPSPADAPIGGCATGGARPGPGALGAALALLGIVAMRRIGRRRSLQRSLQRVTVHRPCRVSGSIAQ
jgi:MYXO-CTERM domain-containing protein